MVRTWKKLTHSRLFQKPKEIYKMFRLRRFLQNLHHYFETLHRYFRYSLLPLYSKPLPAQMLCCCFRPIVLVSDMSLSFSFCCVSACPNSKVNGYFDIVNWQNVDFLKNLLQKKITEDSFHVKQNNFLKINLTQRKTPKNTNRRAIATIAHFAHKVSKKLK